MLYGKEKKQTLNRHDCRYNINVLGQRVNRTMYRTQRFTYLKVMKSKQKQWSGNKRVSQVICSYKGNKIILIICYKDFICKNFVRPKKFLVKNYVLFIRKTSAALINMPIFSVKRLKSVVDDFNWKQWIPIL